MTEEEFELVETYVTLGVIRDMLLEMNCSAIARRKALELRREIDELRNQISPLVSMLLRKDKAAGE